MTDLSPMESQQPATQAEIDKTTYDMYLDCHLDASAASRQLGCSPSTVKRRVERHVMRGHRG